MLVLTGRFDGRQVIFDVPVPSDIPPDTRVKVVFEQGEPVQPNLPASSLEDLVRLAKPYELLPDFAEQHEHYVKGTPRK